MKLTNGFYIDGDQGQDANDKAFGYIGRTVAGQDYQGWFFTYPASEAVIWTVAERERVLDSLELASEEWHCKSNVITWHQARAILNQYLRETFDLRRTPASVARSQQYAY